MAELMFTQLVKSEGSSLGDIVIYPSIPHAQNGFEIQWAEANVDWSSGAGPYTDTVWITDDNRKDAQGNPLLLWVQAINLPGLAPQQSESRTISVPAGAIPACRCQIHVYIDSQGQVPEWDFTDRSNYTYGFINIET